MNAIKAFYENESENCSPTLDDVLNADFDWLETRHDWCQRAFPNYEPSEMVAGSPVLDDETLFWIARNHKSAVMALTFKYLCHYTSIAETNMLPHNNRRITRLLKFLVMLGYSDAVDVAVNLSSRHLEYMMFAETNNEFDTTGYFKTIESWNQTIDYWNNALTYNREQK